MRARLGLLQQLQQPLAVQAAGRLQHPQLEVAADHRGNLQDPLAVVGQAAEPLGDHRPDPLRQPALEHPGAAGDRIEPALAGQQPHHLGDEQRVAVGLLVQRRGQRRRGRHPGHQRDEAGHVLLVQPAQQHPPAVPPSGQVGQGRHQRMPPVDLCVPVDAHHQQAGTLQLATHEAQQGQRRRVRPVQVVEDQQQRAAGGRRPQEGRQAVEQLEAGHLRLDRRRAGQVRQTVADVRGQLGDVGGTRAQVVAQRRRVAGLDVGADHLDPGPEGGCALSLPAAAPQHPGATRCRLGGQLLGQPGLADSGLAGQQHHPAVTGASGIQVGGERGQLALTTDERCRHQARGTLHRRGDPRRHCEA